MTTASELPDPLVPAEVDLRDFGFMPLDVRTLLTSSLWIKAKKDPRVAHAAVSLWCEAWHQVPAGSLPDDDEVLADLARCDEKEWKRIRERALAHFVKCSDGMLYHRLIAEKAIEAWERREDFREIKSNKDTRQQRWRAKVKRLSSLLRDAGVTPPMNPSKGQLEELCRLHVDGFVDADVDAVQSTSASTGASTVDKHETAKTGTGTGTGTEKEIPGRAADSPKLLRAPDDDPPEANGHGPTPAGAVCLALRAAGLQRTNPGHPTLLALLEAGATQAEFTGLAPQALGKRDPFAWLLTALVGQRQDAKELAGTMAQGSIEPDDPDAWRKSDVGLRAMAEQLGAATFVDADVDFAAWQRRITRQWERAGKPALNAGGATA